MTYQAKLRYPEMGIIINGLRFKNKTSLKCFVKGILSNSKSGKKIDGDDDIFLRELINYHPDSIQKIGQGIDYFTVRACKNYRTRHFIIVRLDGAETDFSYLACIDGENKNKDVFNALRFAICDQILDFKQEALSGGPIFCEFTGIKLNSNNSHVDHIPPSTFQNIAMNWLQAINKQPQDIKISSQQDNQTKVDMVDRAQLSSWQDWHKVSAKLRLISKQANLSHVKISIKEGVV